jgi:hypothetical protein
VTKPPLAAIYPYSLSNIALGAVHVAIVVGAISIVLKTKEPTNLFSDIIYIIWRDNISILKYLFIYPNLF